MSAVFGAGPQAQQALLDLLKLREARFRDHAPPNVISEGRVGAHSDQSLPGEAWRNLSRMRKV